MLINTFWKILLKIVGLWILFSSISLIPQFTSTLSFTNGSLDVTSLLSIWFLLFGSLFIYALITFLFIFKTDWIIKRLKLDKNFQEQKIDLNIESTTILKYSIIIIGALILIEALPSFFSRLFNFFQQKLLFKDYRDSSWLIFYFIKLIIGYLLLTNGKNFAKFIERNSNN